MLGLTFLLNSSGKNTWFHDCLVVMTAGEPIDELIGRVGGQKCKKRARGQNKWSAINQH